MIKLYWQDACKTILVREMDATWEWDEYYEYKAIMSTMIREVGHPVIVLVDGRKISDSSGIPPNALHHISESNKGLPDNLIAQIVVSESKWLEAISRILHHLLPEENKKLIFVRTMEKAERQIAKLSKQHRRKAKSKA